jgi:hypothetical protein
MSEEGTPLAETPVAETIAPTPVSEPVDLTTKIEDEAAPEPAAEVKEEPAPELTDEGEEPQDKKKNIPGSQRLKRRLELIEADFLAERRERERLEAQLTARQQPANEGQPGVDRPPTEADFPNDYFAYQEARTAYTARQAIRDEFNRVREQEQKSGSERARYEAQRERLEIYSEYADEVRGRIPDFDKVIQTAANVPVKPELADEILSSDKSALLQYHLAKNPDKVRELNSLSGRELAREIGRLEARVHLPTAKKATEATPPPSQIRGAAATAVDPRTGPDDMNAYVAWRKKQMASS